MPSLGGTCNHQFGVRRVPSKGATQSTATALITTPTLTFLFTDVEGSTALLRRLGGAYAEVLTAHRRLIRAGLAAHGGKEIDTQGDAFFAVFTSPSACAAAAIEMQRALVSHPWPAGERVQVRMGVHSGEASKTPAGLVGLDVHRSARIAAVAHGGQIVVSAAAVELLRDSLPAGRLDEGPGLGDRRPSLPASGGQHLLRTQPARQCDHAPTYRERARTCRSVQCVTSLLG